MMAMGSNNLSTGTEDKPQSTTQLSQFSKTDSSGKTKKAPSKIEEEENDVILQKLGVISATDNNGTRSKGSRSGISYGSGRSRGRRSQWADESGDEYGHNHKGRRLDRIRRGHEAQRCCCCTTRTCVFLTFALLISFALALYFLVPRTPYFAFESVTPNGPPVITKDRIREPFAIQILIDSKSNYVPIRIDAIEMTVWLQYNRTKIADNDDMASSFVIQPRVDQVISIPMILNYRSYRMDISTDKVLQELVEACTYVDLDSLDEGVMVPGINLIVGGRLHIWGLSWIWKPTFSFDADNVPCPVNSRDRPAGISPGGDPGNPSTSSIVRPVPVPSATAMMTSIV
ncbi:hypothetical protein BCR41DRAFT_348050 [Lobosporangium transversale]|uniref:Late embryogenesis abundant protein LEA-2 subgroup domain-containing protein n=1 Tax=Lobosporangium transversale TaxID=64571 RepID=A0A1Y2GXT3_9FUNG|nr:hypothetical protein BCR41DRAFT_348050 [Lobosporangium transversale]ORZ26283.1 hypothetical protein BCR41DRAFT_348050 [Lobosporangium transversale]|eukprot:XP_021884048.1 hypothetical protein BCR41DRAFT_348050 [Lobosporangium transversale]